MAMSSSLTTCSAVELLVSELFVLGRIGLTSLLVDSCCWFNFLISRKCLPCLCWRDALLCSLLVSALLRLKRIGRTSLPVGLIDLLMLLNLAFQWISRGHYIVSVRCGRYVCSAIAFLLLYELLLLRQMELTSLVVCFFVLLFVCLIDWVIDVHWAFQWISRGHGIVFV